METRDFPTTKGIRIIDTEVTKIITAGWGNILTKTMLIIKYISEDLPNEKKEL